VALLAAHPELASKIADFLAAPVAAKCSAQPRAASSVRMNQTVHYVKRVPLVIPWPPRA
jgi:hypothetical protein